MVFPALYAMALFSREDAIEAAWAVVDPVLKRHYRARPYKRRGWEPKEAGALIASDGRWHNPSLKEASESCACRGRVSAAPIAAGGESAKIDGECFR
jgi:hypothetical protein